MIGNKACRCERRGKEEESFEEVVDFHLIDDDNNGWDTVCWGIKWEKKRRVNYVKPVEQQQVILISSDHFCSAVDDDEEDVKMSNR